MIEIYQLHEKKEGKLSRNKKKKLISRKKFEFDDMTRIQEDSVLVLSEVISEAEINMKRSKKKFKFREKQISISSETLKLIIKVESKKSLEESIDKKARSSSKLKKSLRKKIRIELSNDDHERFLIKSESSSEAETEKKKKNSNVELLMKALEHMQLYREMTSDHDRKLRKLIEKNSRLIRLFEEFKEINNELILQQKKIREKIKTALI